MCIKLNSWKFDFIQSFQKANWLLGCSQTDSMTTNKTTQVFFILTRCFFCVKCLNQVSHYLSPGLSPHTYHYGSFAGGERHIGQGGDLMPALIKRPRAPLTCNNQLTCLKRHLFKNTCFPVCWYDSYYEIVIVMWV